MQRSIHLFRLILAGILSSGLLISCTSPPFRVQSPGEDPQSGQQPFHQEAVFVSGTGGYHTFRIPALAVTARGTVLAFCEGRRGGRGDSGNIDLVLRRSLDGGTTWEPLQVVWDDGGNTCGNPAPVVDRRTGTVWLLMTWNDGHISESEINQGKGVRDVWVTHSRDDGRTWAKPVHISARVKKPDWRWYATGPGHGIQTRDGCMLISCDHSTGPEFNQWRSHVIYSRDGGQTWNLGGEEPGAFTNESTIVELANGSLYLNMRSYMGDHRRRISFSRDGGATWSESVADNALIEPRCQGSAIRYTQQPTFAQNRILFSNPASEKREKMTVRISYDETKTWKVSRLIHDGPAAYSDLAVLPDRRVGLLYERGMENPYETIAFASMTLEWLTDGQDKLP